MMRKQVAGVVGALAVSLGGMSATAHAEDPISYTLTLGVASDYIFRGISYSEEDAVVQPSLEFSSGIFYAGVWGSLIDFAGAYGPWEMDLYAGMRPTTGSINWDLAVFYYTYGVEDPTIGGGDLNYFEFKLGASTAVTDKLTVGVTGYFTPEQDIAVTQTATLEGSASYTLPDIGIFSSTASGLVGWTTSDTAGYWLGDKEYAYWNAGLSLGYDKFYVDFRYWDTTIDDGLADERFVISAGVSLP